ncbi:hypothetical protein [Methanoculleus sp.]|uniref:hypothetical protein n=1 Tax=Methanoculleus sp. TaxID=90427 RepID=UPI0025F0BD85|nr:hypothetical protein [Methanoculleus sp.]MCK9318917.1 hypothetical protein [Methanoculleus sp.]
MNNLTTFQEKTLKVVKEASRARPVTAKRLAFIINLKENPGKEGANMRSIIHALRVKGYPICANGKGYYYAQTSTELSEYIVSLGTRIMKVEEAVKGLQKSFDKVRSVRCANQEQITRLF